MSRFSRCRTLLRLQSLKFHRSGLHTYQSHDHQQIAFRNGFIGLQERYKWESSDDGYLRTTRNIRTETNCPRCSKHMDLFFSNRQLPPNFTPSAPHAHASATGGGVDESVAGGGSSVDVENVKGEGGYQAVNLCPNCKTAYYFRSNKIAALQGSFIEIGRVRASFWPSLIFISGSVATDHIDVCIHGYSSPKDLPPSVSTRA